MLTGYRFSVLLPVSEDTQWEDLDRLLVQRIRKTLPLYGISQAIIDAYVPADTVLEKCITGDPEAIRRFHHAANLVRENYRRMQDLAEMQRHVNAHSCLGGNGYHGVSFRVLKSALECWYDVPSFALEITLDLQLYAARRTLIVPSDHRFFTLHRCLQAAFRWKDCQAHAFVLNSPRQGVPLCSGRCSTGAGDHR